MASKKASKKQSGKGSSRECRSVCSCTSGGGCGYLLGFLGAAIYYVSTATGFWSGVLGILKALVWPVFVVMKILGL